jgi:hypothetical protein
MVTYVGDQLPKASTAAGWSATNPILGEGEIGWETDTNKRKTGNGTAPWNSLPYDYGHGRTILATEVTFAPFSTLEATNVQAAIAEVFNEGGGGGGGGGAVSSVNGQIGVVVLTAADVGALATSILDTILSVLPLIIVYDGDSWEVPAGLTTLGVTAADFHKRIWIGPDEPVDLPTGSDEFWQQGDIIINTGS